MGLNKLKQETKQYQFYALATQPFCKTNVNFSISPLQIVNKEISHSPHTIVQYYWKNKQLSVDGKRQGCKKIPIFIVR